MIDFLALWCENFQKYKVFALECKNLTNSVVVCLRLDVAGGSDIFLAKIDIVLTHIDIALCAVVKELVEMFFFLVIPSVVEESSRRRIYALRILTAGYSQQLCLRIETYGYVFYENVATLISAFKNPCKQVFSLDIDRMT